MNQNEEAEEYLQKNGIINFDLDLKTIEILSSQEKEETIPIVIEHDAKNSVGTTSIENNQAIGSFEGEKLTFFRRYLNEYVSNDLIIELKLAASGNSAANRKSTERFDNDLEIYSIKISSRTNNEVLNQNGSDSLVYAPLFTEIYEGFNQNLQSNYVGEAIYPNVNDLESANAENPTVGNEKTFRLSEVFGGETGYFGKSEYISDDLYEYEITFTPNYTKYEESAANNVFSENVLANFVIHTTPQAMTCKITQMCYKIPGFLREELESQLFYIKYDNIEKVNIQDVVNLSQSKIINGVAVTEENKGIKFNVQISKKDFGNKLKSIFIGHLLSSRPFMSTHGNLSLISMGQTLKKIVPLNLLFLAEVIEIKFGQQTFLDLESNDEVIAYFMEELEFLNLPEDLSKCAVVLKEDMVEQFSNKENVVLSVYIKLEDQIGGEVIANATSFNEHNTDFELLKEDFYVYVMGEQFQINSSSGSKYFDGSMLI